MEIQQNKTKIVCTIGPASESSEILEKMILSGMNVARINFSHGDFTGHERVIKKIRTAAQRTKRRVTIMADLPGPKMRIGRLAEEPIELTPGDSFTLTTEEIVGDHTRVFVTFSRLPKAVKKGDSLFLNDGIIELRVDRVEGKDVHCLVLVGGELRSRKGLNLPGIELGISAFTDRDHECLKFALEQGVDAVSQSFVETAEDIQMVREAAGKLGHHPFIIAKIERAGALKNMDHILKAADGIMVARGDLGVEIPIAKIAMVQKTLMDQANTVGKPVITATQMLESMTNNRRPTRAEATDVANAILDGTDCVMLSGESAMGKDPVAAVTMLVQIAADVEPYRPRYPFEEALETYGHDGDITLTDLISLSVEATLKRVRPAAVIVPTRSGYTARMISRFKLPVWITAVSRHEGTCQGLAFSYGVFPVHEAEPPDDWKPFARKWLRTHNIEGNIVVLTEGPSKRNPEANNRMELMDLNRG